MARKFRLSAAISETPLRYDTAALIHEAEELLRRQSNAAARDPIPPNIIDFYIDRRLVDPAAIDAEGTHFTRRHLMQLMAVQVLRGLQLGLEEIGELVREVDDKNLRLLIDEPEEAEKKANVMRNWLGVIARGRYKNQAEEDAAAKAYAEGEEMSVTALPPSLTPRRVPLVPTDAADSRSKRTIMGSANMTVEELGGAPEDLPSTLPFSAAAIATKPTPRIMVPRRRTDADKTPEPPPDVLLERRNPYAASTWSRMALFDGLELHIRSDFDRDLLQDGGRTSLLARIDRLLDE